MAKVQGLARFKAKVKRLRKAGGTGAETGLLKAGKIVTDEQSRLAPVDKGDLAASLEYKLARGTRTGNQAVRITANDFKAHLVEFGTAPHKIKPKGGKALQIGANEFSADVEHPGTTAQPFFFPGYRASRRRARSAIGKGVRDDVRKAVR